MIKNRVFGHGTSTSILGSPDRLKAAKRGEEVAKEKEQAKVDLKEPEEHSLVKNKHRTLDGGQKKIVLGGPKEREARKVSSKGDEGFQKGGFRTYQPEKGASDDFNPHKGRGKDQQANGKEGAYPHSGLSASETHSEERYSHAWESDDRYFSLTDDSSTSATGWSCSRAYAAWMASAPVNLANHPTHVVLDLGCTRSTGSRAAIKLFQKHALFYGMTTEFCRCNKSSVFANSETNLLGKLYYPLSDDTTMFYQCSRA